MPVLLRLLDSAESQIDIVAFSFAVGSTKSARKSKNAASEIANKLIELKQTRDLKIRLYIEGQRETNERNRVTAHLLSKAGVKVKYGSTHAKGFCVDNRYLLFGSTNLTNQSIVKNNEANLVIDDPNAISGFNQYFNHLWKGGKHGEIKLPPPMIADGGFQDYLLEMINSAKSWLEFSIYFFHHSEIENALIRAHKREVKITALFHHHNSFGLSYVRRTRGTAERLRKTGIENIYYGPGHLFTHSKFLIKDRKEVLLGTGNWLHEDIKVHPQLYVHYQDKVLAKEFSAYLKQVIRNL